MPRPNKEFGEGLGIHLVGSIGGVGLATIIGTLVGMSWWDTHGPRPPGPFTPAVSASSLPVFGEMGSQTLAIGAFTAYAFVGLAVIAAAVWMIGHSQGEPD